jgi:hexosaminidase
MRRTRTRLGGVAAAVLALAGPVAHAAPAAPALLPAPRTAVVADGALALTGPFKVQVEGCQGPLVEAALARFQRDLDRLVGASLGGPGPPLRVGCVVHDAGAMTLETREGYRLDVAASGVDIEADGEIGVLRALATLRQLVSVDKGAAVVAAIRIDDAPRFAWRGVMIDTARHFISVATLKRQIDAMELAKLNVLHLHLSDNEAFRVESRRLPKLTSVASHGQFYTQAEIRDLVRYAAERGVRVVPEIDLPGHSLALLSAYPELAAKPLDPKDPLVTAKAALNPASKKTDAFVEALLGEMSGLFPDAYFHVGGDEVAAIAWEGVPEIEAFKAQHGLKSSAELQAYFHARVRKILIARRKTMIGWDELAEMPIPSDVVVQAWRSSNPVSTATARGNRVIVSAGYYLDLLRPAEAYYAIDPVDPVAYSTMTPQEMALAKKIPAAAPFVSDGLLAKPLPPLTPGQEKLVLGGEAPLWSELVSDEMLDGRLWPRAAVVGERLWSPASFRDPDDMLRRLAVATEEFRALGLADQIHRDRMTARLAPDAAAPVATLVEAVAPVRNHAHNHALRGAAGKPQELIEVADAASTDSLAALRFDDDVHRYLAGDRSRAPLLRAQLSQWRDNDAAFAVVAAGRPLLEAALPTSRNLAALGRLGLAAVAAIESGQPMTQEEGSVAHELLAQLDRDEAASKDLMSSATRKQPAADLIIRVAPAVGRLVDAAPKSH